MMADKIDNDDKSLSKRGPSLFGRKQHIIDASSDRTLVMRMLLNKILFSPLALAHVRNNSNYHRMGDRGEEK